MHPDEWKRAEAIYQSALEQAPEERAAFVARACGKDQRLHAEIVSLLAAHDRAGSFLAAPALEDAARRLAARDSFANALAAPRAARIGHTLNQYRIVSAIGKGGMGEVYLAEDTRLHRQVALKLLPAEFSADPMRVRRFEQEARAVSALNHPNIVTLYDVGRCGDEYFMATEFVEGRTLRDCLNEHGRLPADEACGITAQIAAALGAAHDAGIVHRDIKPENVMLRRDGYVKVLDFGLAKLSKDRLTGAPESSLTEAGTVMGTVSYLSPEQARGMHVDARTDVFSLGVVCYEMLAGRLPFAGQTANDVIASILRSDPEPLADAGLNRMVMKALAKDRESRYQTVTDFAGEIKQISQELAFEARLADSSGKARRGQSGQQAAKTTSYEISASQTKAAPLQNHRAASLKLLASTAAVMLAILAGWQTLMRRYSDSESWSRPNPKNSLVRNWQMGMEASRLLISISRDGKWIAFSNGENGRTDIFVEQLSEGQSVNITNDAWVDISPIWSPDGNQIAYLSKRDNQTEVWISSLLGLNKQKIATLGAETWWLMRWSNDGRKIFYEAGKKLYVLDTQDADQKPAFIFDASQSERAYFSISMDEQWIAYSEKGSTGWQIWARPLVGGAPIQVTREGEENTYPLWLPDGERIIHNSKRDGQHQLYVSWLHKRKSEQVWPNYDNPTPWEISSDGQTIYYLSSTGRADLFLHHPGTRIDPQLSSDLALNLYPNFSPDGKKIVYQRFDQDRDFFNGSVLTMELDGGGQAPTPIRIAANGFDPRWSPRPSSPEGQLAFLRKSDATTDLWTVRGDGADERLVKQGIKYVSFAERPYSWRHSANFSWSPDGRWLAFVSDQPGQSNVQKILVENKSEEPVSSNTDSTLKLFSPLWSPDGSKIAYLAQRTMGKQIQSSVLIHGDGGTRTIFESNSPVRLLGWSLSGEQFFISTIDETTLYLPTDVKLYCLLTDRIQPEEIGQLPKAYFYSLMLCASRQQIAFVSRQYGSDEVKQFSLKGGSPRTLISNNDPGVYFSGLAWSPNQPLLAFFKQSTTTSIRKIENFK